MIAQTTTQPGDRTLIFLLLAAALVLFCVDLGGVPLRDWDEGTVAQVAREISLSETWTGWLHPQLWGQPYLNKPPFLHGLMALAFQKFGVHTWTARLPGAVLTAISVPLLFMLGREIFPTRPPALIGALVYLTFLPMVRHGRLAMLDGAIVCFFIALLWMLMKARRNSLWYLGVGFGFALMCLTKGMLGILLLAIALLFIAWDDPKQLVASQLWGGLLLGSVPVLAWYGGQWQQYGQQFINTTVLAQSAERIWRTVERNDGPPWYYLLELLKYSWPWLIFWPLGIRLTWRSRRYTWAKLLLVWTVCYFGTISVMGTKLPWYVFPLYPAIALTAGIGLTAAWNKHRSWNGRSLSVRRFPLIWSVLLALLSIVGAVGIVYSNPWGEVGSPALMFAFGCIMLSTGAAAVFVARQQTRFVPTLMIGFYFALVGFVVSDYWVWELGEDFPVLPVAALIQAQTPAGQVIYSDHDHERPSLNFYSDRQVKAISTKDLQQEQPVYLLVKTPDSYRTVQPPFVELGQAEGWFLISNMQDANAP